MLRATARAHARSFVGMHFDEHLTGAVQRGEHVAAVVGHDVLADALETAQPIADRVEEIGYAVAGRWPRSPPNRGDRRRVASRRRGSAAIGLRQHEQHGHVTRVDLTQHRVDCGDARVGFGRRRVDEVDEQIRVRDLFERRTERLHELVRQRRTNPTVSDSSTVSPPGRCRRRVVGSSVENNWSSTSTPAFVEPVEQRRLSRVRVADKRDSQQLAPAAGLALRVARRRELQEVALELLHPAEQPAPVDLELRLTRAPASADASGLLAQLLAPAPQPRQEVAQLRELDLHHAFLARRVLGEDVEDRARRGRRRRR